MGEILHSKSYGSRLIEGLWRLRESEILSDLILVVDETNVPVHRVVMAAGSDYFQALLTIDMKEKHQQSIVLKGVPLQGLNAVVKFAYTGQLQCSAANISDILLAATHLQFTEAVDLCSFYLTNLTNHDNSIEMYCLAEQFNLVSLQEKAMSLILSNFRKIAQSPAFLKFHHCLLIEIVKDNRLKVNSELELFRLIMKWVKFDAENRKKWLTEILSGLRFPLIQVEGLVQEVMQEELMKSEPGCLELLLEANTYHMLPMRQPMMQTPRTQVRSDSPSLIMFDLDDEQNPKVLDLGDLSWSSLQYSKLENFRPQVCSINNYMYVCGGIAHYSCNFSSSPVSGKSFRFDPRFNRWDEIRPMPTPRHQFTLQPAPDDLSFYAIGGVCSGEYKNEIEQYLIAEDIWVAKTTMNIKTSSAASASGQGRIFVAGGQTEHGITKALLGYHLRLDKWFNMTEMNHPRMDHAMCAYNKKLYAIGGYSKNIINAFDVDDIDCYDIETDQWNVYKVPSPKMSSIFSCIIGSCFYCVGGFSYNENKKRSEVMKFDIDTGKWQVIARIPTATMAVPLCTITLPNSLNKLKET